MDVLSSAHHTIFALSSGAVPAGIAVIRISGAISKSVIEQLAGELPAPNHASYRSIRSPDGSLIDRGLVIFFASPHSFTGEDSAEFHIHGSRATVARMLEVLATLPGMRAAEAGEFTLRAFRNGKMDLTEAEALSDLIAAETDFQRQFALANGSRLAREQYYVWRGRLIEHLALVEATLDFSDEEHAPDELGVNFWADAVRLADEIEAYAEQYHRSEIIRDGFRVAIIGAPNAGKSSLLNSVARREVAIVTSEAGTTRDVIEIDLNLGGLLVKFSDTAGIRESENLAEQMGVERSRTAARDADLLLWVEDAMEPIAIDLQSDAPRIRVGTKVDQIQGDGQHQYDVCISNVTGTGIDTLLKLVEMRARESTGSGQALPFRARHVALLREGAAAIRRAAEIGPELELIAEEFRHAANCMGRITGQIDVEDLLDVIFSRFCIGK